MYPRTVISDTQWQEAFDAWATGLTLQQLARQLHVDERRITQAFKAISPLRYAQIKSAKARLGSQAPAQRPKGRPWHKVTAVTTEERAIHGEVRAWDTMTVDEHEAILQRLRQR